MTRLLWVFESAHLRLSKGWMVLYVSLERLLSVFKPVVNDFQVLAGHHLPS